MAGKIPKETKEAIIKAFRGGTKSKAQLAREYEVSVSSITRIVSAPPAKPPSSPGEPGNRAQARHGNSDEGQPGIGATQAEAPPKPPRDELERALVQYKDTIGDQSIETLVEDFISWISRRDRGEKELISLEMAIESLKLERNSIESEISRLGSKAGSLEILIGKMRKLAEDSQTDLSLVEERLSNIEEKLAIDHDILLIGSAIRMILRGDEIDDELLTMIADISRENPDDYQGKREAVRKALTEYSDFFRRRIRTQ